MEQLSYENRNKVKISKKPTLEFLLNVALELKLFPRKQSLVYHFKDVFKNIELTDKNVLDIGGGIGILSFFSAINGARNIVCLEPESDGSSSGMIDQFNKFKNKLHASLPITHLPLTLQQYLKKPTCSFDVVILNNSINHLNENACIKLKEHKDAYNEYLSMFTLLYENMNKGGKLVISDCSNKNFYNQIGFNSPFINGIEWHKHHSPKTWIKLLERIGFSDPVIEWSSPNRAGIMGRALLKNSFCAFFTSSHFRIVMKK